MNAVLGGLGFCYARRQVVVELLGAGGFAGRGEAGDNDELQIVLAFACGLGSNCVGGGGSLPA